EAVSGFFSFKAFLASLFACFTALLIFGAWGKVREGKAVWGRRYETISSRVRDPGGFWLSVGFNIAGALAFGAAALAVLFS
ncbi:MAG: hypothetical protein PHE36_13700, partial [Novosphingobium sp.]|nr:hypothetical protein [Novosphingobium sp.]